MHAAQDTGSQHYTRRGARCHGDDGHGGEREPAIVERLALRSDEQLATLIRDGLPAAGMPGVTMSDAERRSLVAFVRTLRPRSGTRLAHVTVVTTDGLTLEGRRLNHSATDLQILSDGDEPRIHLLRPDADRHRQVTSQVNWPTYNGNVSGNHFSLLDQIDATTVSRLAPRWVFTLPGNARLRVTPVVVDGIMYVTSGNECYALDAGSGRQLWHYRRPRTEGVAGDAGAGINRGVAVAGRHVFMVTDHAHLIALDRFTGALVWDTEMADWRQNYGATSAPLVVGDLVISGTSGGDEGIRGFLAAFDRTTGREAWRFWTVPRRGEPGSETWRGTDIDHPCASTWLTGTYDPDLDMLYWPTGNPCPDYDGAQRQGDNLYSDSTLALDPRTGELRWHYQYTPHDLWDLGRTAATRTRRSGVGRSASKTPATREPERLLLRARPDRRDAAAGGAVREEDHLGERDRAGRSTGPQPRTATDWRGHDRLPGRPRCHQLVLDVVPSRHRAVLRADPGALHGLHAHARAVGGGPLLLRRATRNAPGELAQKIPRAIDIQTGDIAWELPQIGPANSWGGTLATAGGLVFVGADGGALMAVDAETGVPLWSFQTNAVWKASPMTYMFDQRQHIGVAARSNILSFTLVDDGSARPRLGR